MTTRITALALTAAATFILASAVAAFLDQALTFTLGGGWR